MANNQMDLFSQLLQEMEKNGVSGIALSSSIAAFWAADESARAKLVQDYKTTPSTPSVPSPDKPEYNDISLCNDLLSKMQAAGITHQNPLYAQYVTDFWSASDKSAFVNNFGSTPDSTPPAPTNNDEQTIGENEGGNPVDDAWKAGMRDAFQKAADKHQQLYEETPDANNPHNLKFNFYDSQANKDAQRPDGSVVYHDRNHVSLKSQNYNHFLTTVEAAKNAGIKTITFGESIQTPEYKANLYMACLKLGMEMKNPPAIEDIKGINPKLDHVLTMMEMRKEVMVARKKVAELQPQVDNDPECQTLLKSVKDAKNALSRDKDNQDLKDALAAAKNALNANPLSKSLNDAKTAEKTSMKKAFDYVVSQKSDDEKATIKKKTDPDLKLYDDPNPRPTKTLTQKDGESDADFQSRQARYTTGKALRDTDKDVQARRKNTQYVIKSVVSGR